MAIDEDMNEAVDKQVDGLGDARKSLSKVLFPETDTDKIMVLGKVRTLFPVPVKIARRLNAKTAALSEKLGEAFTKTTSFDANDELVKALLDCGAILAEFYGWGDVLAATQEEGITLSDLQLLVGTQTQLNGRNDFLLAPLRVLFSTMQIVEIMSMQFQNMLSSLPSSTSGAGASTS